MIQNLEATRTEKDTAACQTVQVQKKDGRLEPYQSLKVQRALAKALQSVEKEEAWQTALRLAREMENAENLSKDGLLKGTDVDGLVKQVLLSHGYHDA